MEPSTANFNAFVSNCGQCFMYSLGHQVGNAIIAQFRESDGYISVSYTHLTLPTIYSV